MSNHAASLTQWSRSHTKPVTVEVPLFLALHTVKPSSLISFQHAPHTVLACSLLMVFFLTSFPEHVYVCADVLLLVLKYKELYFVYQIINDHQITVFIGNNP